MSRPAGHRSRLIVTGSDPQRITPVSRKLASASAAATNRRPNNRFHRHAPPKSRCCRPANGGLIPRVPVAGNHFESPLGVRLLYRLARAVRTLGRPCSWHPENSCSPANPSAWAIPTSWPTRSPTASSTPSSRRTHTAASPARRWSPPAWCVIAGEITTKADRRLCRRSSAR